MLYIFHRFLLSTGYFEWNCCIILTIKLKYNNWWVIWFPGFVHFFFLLLETIHNQCRIGRGKGVKYRRFWDNMVRNWLRFYNLQRCSNWEDLPAQGLTKIWWSITYRDAVIGKPSKPLGLPKFDIQAGKITAMFLNF